MSRSYLVRLSLVMSFLAVFTGGLAHGQFPKADDPEFEAKLKLAVAAIKPLPLTPIPDEPPPHEGALIDETYVIEPPDLLLIEVLEALPGRPISGERLVRPDGKISLGFYGELEVRGLTTDQVKVKVVEHLRFFLPDSVLGLSDEVVVYGPTESKPLSLPPLPERQELFLPPNSKEGAASPGAKPTSATRKRPTVTKRPKPSRALLRRASSAAEKPATSISIPAGAT